MPNPNQQELDAFRAWLVKTYPDATWLKEYSNLESYMESELYPQWQKSPEYVQPSGAVPTGQPFDLSKLSTQWTGPNTNLFPSSSRVTMTQPPPKAITLSPDEVAANAAMQTANQISAASPTTPSTSMTIPLEYLGLEEQNGYLVPKYKMSDGTTQFVWSEARESRGMTDADKARLDEEKRQFNLGREISPYQQEQLNYQQKQLGQEQTLQTQMIDWYKQQQSADLENQKQQRLATLRANPASWLEYASLAGETPAIQPWMVPLQTFGNNQFGTSNKNVANPITGQSNQWQAGQAMPGWTPQSTGQASLSGLPELKTPSAQYMARIAPSSQEQLYGYQQARTGARPEDTQWQQWNLSPSGGRPGLKYI